MALHFSTIECKKYYLVLVKSIIRKIKYDFKNTKEEIVSKRFGTISYLKLFYRHIFAV